MRTISAVVLVFLTASMLAAPAIARDSTYGAQAFIDMTVGRKWAVNLGLKYLDAQLSFDSRPEYDFSPVILRVMGVYRWGRHD